MEIGFGLAPSARGHGYAAEALVGVVSIAAQHGLSRAVADTTTDYTASQRTLERAGFHQVGGSGDHYLYEVLLGATAGAAQAQ